MSGPLAGVRVVDLTRVLAGPVCTMLLADQGAEVIKVETLEGDSVRGPASGTGFSPMFVSANRGKRTLALDLKHPAGHAALLRLIATADVLVENFRPGTMQRLNLSEPSLRKLNPRLIYASITGVGDSGPYVKKRVYDPIVQALSGIADVQADGSTGRPRMVRTVMADKTTGLYAAQAISSALFARERSGEGQHIRLAMLDAMVGFIWPESMTQHTVLNQTKPALDPNARPDLIYQTSDSYITVGTNSDSEWRGLCQVLNKPEWVQDARFKSGAGRSINAAERITLVGELLKAQTSAHWLPLLDAAQVPCAPVLRRHEVAHNEQVLHNRLIEEFDQPLLGRVRQPRPAAQFDRTPAAIAGPARRLGEDTRAILVELGYSEAEIGALIATRAALAAEPLSPADIAAAARQEVPPAPTL